MKHAVLDRYALRALSIGGLGLVSACGGSGSGGAMPPGDDARQAVTYSATFTYTGKPQSFTVPGGRTRITVILFGAAGAGSSSNRGLGGRVWAVIPVTPGERFAVFVGGAGNAQAPGYNGGGSGGANTGLPRTGYGGGGASDVRRGGDKLSDRILVAGGGGGDGGGMIAAAGSGGCAGCGDGYGGSGGTQHQGGLGGSGGHLSSPPCNGASGEPGLRGQGGAGGTDDGCYNYYTGDGGGGGGGYYGGGGGGAGAAYICTATCTCPACAGVGGGGGGGSSYIEPSAIAFHNWRGWKGAIGNGRVVFEW